MAPGAREKRDELRPAPTPRPHKHAPPAYVAKVVADREICHFVQTNGGGDRAVAWIVAQQLGLITAAQLQLAGVGRGAIEARRLQGRVHRMYRGVYLVG